MIEATGQTRDLAALTHLAETSVELILRLQDPTGAYPASPTFSAYSGFCWFRDGAFIADGMSAAGAVESASSFFDWCGRILLAREARVLEIVAAAAAGSPVADSLMLPARFTLAGDDGGDDWWDFQLDGYGTWLWAVVQHSRRHGLDLGRWSRAIELSVDYLVSSWQRPCFDWWEESADRVHVSTLGCVAAGLKAVAETEFLDEAARQRVLAVTESIMATILDVGVNDGHLVKWLGSDQVDGSLLALVAPLGLFPASSSVGESTVEAIDRQLNVGGGVHRYLSDTFFGGGQWPLLSCMLGLAFADAGDADRAFELLDWVAATSNDRDAIPEQVANDLLEPSMEQEWVDRWGPVASPLLWSHAMYIRLAIELGVLEVIEA